MIGTTDTLMEMNIIRELMIPADTKLIMVINLNDRWRNFIPLKNQWHIKQLFLLSHNVNIKIKKSVKMHLSQFSS